MRIRYTEQARDDLAEIVDYLRSRNPVAARNVADGIRSSIETLAHHPRLGRAQSDGSRKLIVTPHPYLVFYDVDDDRDLVSILTIRLPARRRLADDV